MKKRILLTVCFIMLLCLAGCGSPSADIPDGEEFQTVRAIVTKVYEKSMEIQVEKGTLMSMPAEWLEGKAEPKEGLILEITATNEILEVYPSLFSKIISVEVVGFEEPVSESGAISARGDNEEPEADDGIISAIGDNAQQDQKAWEKVVIAPPEGAYCNISFSLPEDWDYSWAQTEDVPVSSISIGIYPKAEGDAKGCIAIKYAEGFGVCGTGLESVETTFNGHVAYKGTYDDHPYWDFVSLSGEYRGCSIWNYAGETWYDKYQEELEEIFATVKFELLICDGVPLKDSSFWD